MRIAWEASALLPPRTGVGRYAFELLRALLPLPEAREAEFHLVWRSLRRDLPAADRAALSGARCHTGRFPTGPMLMDLWQTLGRPRIELFSGPVDLVHGPAAMLPPSRARARILTVHDLDFLRHPEHAHRRGGRFLARHLPGAVRRATRIIVPSEATARDCVDLLAVDRSRIEIIPYGGVEEFLPEPSAEMWSHLAEEHPALPERFWLTIATLEPRKNLGALLDALEILAARGVKSPPLVQVGPIGWRQDALLDRLTALASKRRVYPLGHQSPGTIRCLLRRAEALVMPSLAEGFGLPILEAMASRCPVLCSDLPVFREVTGGHALFFDPRRPESIADVLAQALADPEGSRGRAGAGLAHIAPFTWERAARRTWEVYQTSVT
jgi:glycosyltransferase involved in cell wall biosynthesis